MEHTHVCHYCGEGFTPKRVFTDGVRNRFCSRTCKEKQRYEDGRMATSMRKWRMQDKYGITVEEYEAMREAQGGGCAICGRTDPVGRRQEGLDYWLHVDHCHETGRVRGLLCSQCNTGIGYFGDNIETLGRAIAYLTP